MTNKKTPDSSSPLDDFKLDDEKFKQLFEDKNAAENIENYLDNFINSVNKQLSLNIDQKQSQTPPQKNPHLSALKQDFPKQKPSPPPSDQHTDTPDLLHSTSSSHTINDTSHCDPLPKQSQVNSLLKPRRSKSIPSSKSSLKSKIPSQSNPTSLKKPSFLSKLKKSFQSLSHTFTFNAKPPSIKKPLPKTSKSMDDALDRLKKREEDIKKLLDNNKGSMT